MRCSLLIELQWIQCQCVCLSCFIDFSDVSDVLSIVIGCDQLPIQHQVETVAILFASVICEITAAGRCPSVSHRRLWFVSVQNSNRTDKVSGGCGWSLVRKSLRNPNLNPAEQRWHSFRRLSFVSSHPAHHLTILWCNDSSIDSTKSQLDYWKLLKNGERWRVGIGPLCEQFFAALTGLRTTTVDKWMEMNQYYVATDILSFIMENECWTRSWQAVGSSAGSEFITRSHE